MRRAPRPLGDAEHQSVHVRGHAGEHPLRRSAQPLGPVGAYEVVVAADAAGGDDHRLGTQLEGAGHLAAAGSPRPPLLRPRISPVTVSTAPALRDSPLTRWRNRSSTSPRAPPSRTRRSKGSTTPGPGAPGDVEARDGVAVPVGVVAAALGPADAPGRSARPGRAARTASRRPRSRRTPRPTCAASGPPSRSKPAVPSQSCQASSRLSLIRSRRCSGESTKNSPPNDQCAWPPIDCSGSWSSEDHLAGVDELRGRRQPREARPDHDHVCSWLRRERGPSAARSSRKRLFGVRRASPPGQDVQCSCAIPRICSRDICPTISG